MNFYQSERIGKHLICIRSMSGELMYLIEGEQECILIDSCVGVGELRKYVETLTDKPIKLLLTHGHIDHAMGASEFDCVYLSDKDISIYQKQCELEDRKQYLEAVLGVQAETIENAEYTCIDYNQKFLNIADGMIIECNPYNIECYNFPGHTKGSVIFLIREMRILVIGDACNNSTFLFDEDALSLSQYYENLVMNRDRLKGRYDKVLLSHHTMETEIEVMDNVIEVCEEIFSDRSDDVPFEFMGIEAHVAKTCNATFERSDGKCGNIIYNKAKL